MEVELILASLKDSPRNLKSRCISANEHMFKMSVMLLLEFDILTMVLWMPFGDYQSLVEHENAKLVENLLDSVKNWKPRRFFVWWHRANESIHGWSVSIMWQEKLTMVEQAGFGLGGFRIKRAYCRTEEEEREQLPTRERVDEEEKEAVNESGEKEKEEEEARVLQEFEKSLSSYEIGASGRISNSRESLTRKTHSESA
ncbi:hypothetical protein ACLOJK_027702 [Asimina triloba]